MYTPSSTAFLRPTRGGGGFEFVEYDSNAFPYPQTIGSTAPSISGLGPADKSMMKTIFIMPNKETDSDATLMIVVDEKDPSTDPKTYQYVYVGNINDLPSDVLTEGSIVDNLTTERNDRPLSAKQGRTLNSHVNYTTCGSGAGDQVKLIPDNGFELSTHLRLLVKMNNTNTHANPKFNINNTGIKDVWYNGSVASDTNTWSAGEVLDVYYDGSNNFVANTHGGAQFATGQKVSDVGIDSSDLNNGNVNSITSTLSVGKIKSSIGNTNFDELKVENIQNWHPVEESNGYYLISGNWYNTSDTIKSTRIDISGYDSIRFLGFVKNGSESPKATYGFQDYNGQIIPSTLKNYNFDVEAQANYKKEYFVKIPKDVNAKYFVCLMKIEPIFIENDFYIFLQKGESISLLIEQEKLNTLHNPGIIRLKQYSETRLVSERFPKAAKDVLANLILSNRFSFDICLMGQSFSTSELGETIVSWGQQYSSIKSALLADTTHDYFWFFVAKLDRTQPISQDDVYLTDITLYSDTVYNVNYANNTTSDTTFTLEEAIQIIPKSKRKEGMFVTFSKTIPNRYLSYPDIKIWETWEYRGFSLLDDADFLNTANWFKMFQSNQEFGKQIKLFGNSTPTTGLCGDTNVSTNRVYTSPIQGNFSIAVNTGYVIHAIFKYDINYNYLGLETFTESEITELSRSISNNEIYRIVFAKIDRTQSISPDENIIKSFSVGYNKDFEFEAKSIINIQQGGFGTSSITYQLNRVYTEALTKPFYIEVNEGYIIRFGVLEHSDGSKEIAYESSADRTAIELNELNDGDKIYLTFCKIDTSANIFPNEDIIKTLKTNPIDFIKSSLGRENHYSQYIEEKQFFVNVDTSVANVVDSNLSLQDSQVFESDSGKIYLPKNYTPSGKPTRLIIHCHGASQNYNNGTVFPKTSSVITIDYLLAKGYAVLDVNGLPGNHPFYATTSGNPIAYRSYLKAYEWAISNYNLYKEIFVVGISAGSIPALQISNITTIPVLAAVTYCGIMDFSRAWMLLGGYHGDNTQGPELKAYISQKYGFTGTTPTFGNVDPCSDDEWKYVVDNVDKFEGWNTYTMGIKSTITREEYRGIVSTIYGNTPPIWIPSDYSFSSIQQMLLAFKIPQRGNLIPYATTLQQEQKLYDTCSIYRKVPIKLFHSENDDVAPYRYSKYYYEMCKRGGSVVEFRTFSSGGHRPSGDSITVTINDVEIITNVLSVEVLNWLQRFEIN